jgi:inorganic pyrophosphatase
MPNLIHLPSHDEDGQLQVVVEAPRGSRAKFKYDPTGQTFKFARPLCLGTAYPYDWGFVPGTRALIQKAVKAYDRGKKQQG